MKYVVKVEFPDPEMDVVSVPFDTIEEAAEYAILQNEEYFDYCGNAVILTIEE